MDCRTFRDRLTAYVDGELTDAEAREMDEHADACDGCGQEREAVRHETALLEDAYTHHEAPADLHLNVMRAIDAADELPVSTPERPRSRWTAAIPALAAAAVLVACIGAWVALGPKRAQPPMTVQSDGTLYWASDVDGAPEILYERAQSAPARERPAEARPGPGVVLVSYDGQPLRQSEPTFMVDELADAGSASPDGVTAMNEVLGRPQALSIQEQGFLNTPSPTAPTPGHGGSGAIIQNQQQASNFWAPPAGAPGVSVESTDGRVILDVAYREEEGEFTTIYTANFSADYAIRAPDVNREGVRIAVTFPFPTSCTTVSNSKLVVEGKEDDEHTSYSIAGMRWVNWFEPGEIKTITIAYEALGQGNYRYMLDKNRLTKRFQLLMRIDGLEAGRPVQVPGDALQPTAPTGKYAKEWQYAWSHDRLLTTKDIVVNFPAKESPSATANRVATTVGMYLPVTRYAPLFLILFLGALLLGGVWNPAEAFRLEELVFLGIAFLLFYPLFLFGAAYIGREGALWGAVAAVIIMTTIYVGAIRGRKLIGRIVLLDIVLLGLFTHALFDRALMGLLFTAGAVALLGYFMFIHSRRPKASRRPAERPVPAPGKED